ncbi:SMEK domain-containing protein [Mycoplasma sp. Ms02]|uniref:SMEK domain-containing protein n=1 Tax=Mycoplasma sp. Ms02 TaxID=353851 RepID=UPI001C89F985|nr:SMEK domain-containing protein [Mycoplasma sp. Ms02]QZE12457.1 SMEK domain-containing protein [Mycoplasma sp. Ms02]
MVNANSYSKNNPGFDLIDHKNKIICQITTNTSNVKNKIKRTIEKCDLESLKGYNLIVVFCSSKDINNDYIKQSTNFINENIEILTVPRLVQRIIGLGSRIVEKISNTLDYYFPDVQKNVFKKSELMEVIEYLYTVNIKQNNEIIDTKFVDFKEKIKVNDLIELEDYLIDIFPYCSFVRELYSEKSKEGIPFPEFVTQSISSIYYKIKVSDNKKPEQIYFELVEKVYESKNLKTLNGKISEDSIKFYLQIIILEVFQRCKIFKKVKARNRCFCQ